MKRFLRRALRVFLVLFVLLNAIVAMHAYKFTHFYEAGTVKADSLKTGWDRTKDILLGISAAKKKDDRMPDSAYQTFYLTTQSGLKLEGWYIPVANAKGSVAMFHGHGGNKSGILREADAFHAMGYNCFLLDFRAHGNSEGSNCTIGKKESEDVKLAYDFLAGKGEKNIMLWGISLGAAAITSAINEYDLKPSKVILEMPFGSVYKAVQGRLKVMHLPKQPFSLLLTFWGGLENGFWAFSFKPSEYAKKINCPTLLQWGVKDPRVSREEINDIYENLPGKKQLVLYDSSGHESLCKKEHDKWIGSVSSFMTEN